MTATINAVPTIHETNKGGGMREIKFRAWITTQKKWYGDDIEWFPLRSLINENGCANDLIFSQFTGLHDKNGKEIWEGDKVYLEVLSPDDMAVDGKYGSTGTVVWDNGAFKVESDETHSFYDYMGPRFTWFELEVIGNVFENPELLNPNAEAVGQ